MSTLKMAKPPIRKEKAEERVLVLVDWENLRINYDAAMAGIRVRYSLTDAFQCALDRIAKETGPICGVYIFTPLHLANTDGEDLFERGYYIVYCPKVAGKKPGERRDTTDSQLKSFGERMIAQLKGITHLCIASGDRDYTRLINDARLQGIPTQLVIGSLRSLSSRLIDKLEKDRFGKAKVMVLSRLTNA